MLRAVANRPLERSRFSSKRRIRYQFRAACDGWADDPASQNGGKADDIGMSVAGAKRLNMPEAETQRDEYATFQATDDPALRHASTGGRSAGRTPL
jgi:hypothetical protein